MRGLQNTLLGCTLSFDVIKNEFVQVLHSGGNHWLTVSTIGCKPSVVKVYDSLFSELPTQTKEQICALLVSNESAIELIYVNAKKQANGCDCGLLALAFAAALCAGQDPNNLLFEKSMRLHLLQCLEKEEVTPFPFKTVKRNRESRRAGKINIYCKCRTEEGGNMIACSGCDEWFHEECVTASRQVWKKKKSDWYCDNCKI